MIPLKQHDFSEYNGFAAKFLARSIQELLITYWAVLVFLPIFFGWHYWHLASSMLLKGLWIVGIVVVASVLLALLTSNGSEARPILYFCIALLPIIASQTFIMWKVFGFNLLSVALPYGVVAVVLIAIKFLIYPKGNDIGKEDIAKYNGIFHIFSLNFVALSIFPVFVTKILNHIILLSKLAKSILLPIAIAGSLALVYNVVVFFLMLGNGVFIDYSNKKSFSLKRVNTEVVPIAIIPTK